MTTSHIQIRRLILAESIATQNCMVVLNNYSWNWQVHYNELHELDTHRISRDLGNLKNCITTDTAKQAQDIAYWKLVDIALYYHSHAIVTEAALRNFREEPSLGWSEEVAWNELFRRAAPIAEAQWLTDPLARDRNEIEKLWVEMPMPDGA